MSINVYWISGVYDDDTDNVLYEIRRYVMGHTKKVNKEKKNKVIMKSLFKEGDYRKLKWN